MNNINLQEKDHRILGKEMDLFHFEEHSPGMVFYHANGWNLFRNIENYIRSKLEKQNYQEVKTPIMLDKSLWIQSGHWEKFKQDMFLSLDDDRMHIVKPMSCPGHIQIYQKDLHSYRELPIRYAEFGLVHRNESSGSLNGMMRLKSFTQDDGHIFCRPDQMHDEAKQFISLLYEVYEKFGFKDIVVKFSDRPEKRFGDDDLWDQAEDALRKSCDDMNIKYIHQPGEGAFYGPKLEFALKDSLDRYWQCGTLQLDFVLPKRFNLSYIDQDGSKKPPVILHRAILGSIERWIGILLENYGGRLPMWLNPINFRVMNISEKSYDYSYEIFQKLKSNGHRIDFDFSDNRINQKIANVLSSKIPFSIIIGKNEEEQKVLTLKDNYSNEQFLMSLDEFNERYAYDID